MVAIARELSIVYGGFEVGGDQTARVLDYVAIHEGAFERASVEYSFVILQSTEAGFASEIGLAEAAFRNPNQNLTITQGSATLKSYSHSVSTGFDARPTILKRGDVADTGRSRRYVVRVEFGMPADGSGAVLSGLRSATINVSYTPARRRIVTISGVATSIGGTAARAQYEGLITGYVNSILSGLGGTYKLAEEPTTSENETSKVIEFSRVHEEILDTSVGGNDASVRREVIAITRQKLAPGDTPDGGSTIKRLAVLTVRYEAWIDKDSSQNLTGKWSTLRNSLLAKVRTTLGAGAIALVDEAPEFDFTDNKITATMTIMGVQSGSSVIEYLQTVEDSEVAGVVLVPVWNGNRHAKYSYQGPATFQRIITQVFKTLGNEPQLVGDPLAPPQGFQIAHISRRHSESPVRLGFDGFEINTKEITRVTTIEFFVKVEGKPNQDVPTINSFLGKGSQNQGASGGPAVPVTHFGIGGL